LEQPHHRAGAKGKGRNAKNQRPKSSGGGGGGGLQTEEELRREIMELKLQVSCHPPELAMWLWCCSPALPARATNCPARPTGRGA
jgi:hypothetical protein